VKKNVKRATLVLALAPLISIPASAAMAATTAPLTVAPVTTATTATTSTTGATTTVTHQDAPKATASATAAKVAGIIAIGDTSATAGSSGSSAHAHALDILGQTVSGGDVADGEGPKSGSLLATPDNPIGDLELAPWSGKVTHDGGGSQAQAEAALAHAGLLGALQIWLLHSQSLATWTPDASHGHATSDGAEVNLADQLDVRVLHAETDSDGKGSAAVLVINGQGILTSDQTGNACEIPADPLIDLLCLQATGGKGSDGTTTSAAEVLQETSGVGLPAGDVVGASSGGGVVAQTPSTSTTHRTRRQTGPLPHTTGPSAGRLPFTGSEAGLLAAYGALLAGLGAAITTAARRRRGVTA
jgi:hypothetical protein